MRHLLFLLATSCALFFQQQLFAQTALLDALELARLQRSSNYFGIKFRTPSNEDSLKQYLGILYDNLSPAEKKDSVSGYDDVLRLYQGNPFFVKYKLRRGVGDFSSTPAADAASSRRQPPPGGSLFGGGSVAALADGLARFLVKRTKEELNQAFLGEFVEVMRKNEHFQLLFPFTRDHLSNVGNDIYRFDPFLEGLRNASKRDLEDLPANLEDWLQSPACVKILPREDNRCYLQDAAHTARQLLNRTSPQDVLAYLAHDACYVRAGHFPELSGSLLSLELALKSLREPGDAFGDLVKKDQWSKLLADPMARDFYLGFLWQQGGEACFAKGLDGKCSQTMRNFLDAGTAPQLLNTVDELLDLWQAVKEAKQEIAQAGFDDLADSLKHIAYGIYANASTDLVKLAVDLAGDLKLDTIAFQKIRIRTRVLENLTALALEVRRRHFSQAILHFALLLEEMDAADCSFGQNLLRYGAFMANLALCTDSEEVAAIIEAFALPPGSASIKKKNGFNLAVGSYVSGFLAREKLDGEGGAQPSIALGAPVGVAASLPLKNAGSLSLYGSLFDVGAFTAYRFGNQTGVEELPKLTWENLYAPGAALIWGVPKYPAAVGLYFQKGPNLRKVKEGGVTEFKNAERFGVFVAVDIPLFNVVTVSKKEGCK